MAPEQGSKAFFKVTIEGENAFVGGERITGLICEDRILIRDTLIDLLGCK